MSLPDPIRRALPARIDPPAKRWLQGEVLPPPVARACEEWGEPAPYITRARARPWWRFVAGWAVLIGIPLVFSCLPEIVSFLGRLR